MNSIYTRRSIRTYTSEKVPESCVQQCLKAAMHAPSAGNEQAWEFIVIGSQKGRENLTKVHPYAKMLPSASFAVVICGNKEKLKFPQDYWVEDCSTAAQNFMLQAEELGIGTVWLAVYPCKDRVESISQLLELPASVIPLCIIPMGYPAETKVCDQRFQEEKIHLEKW